MESSPCGSRQWPYSLGSRLTFEKAVKNEDPQRPPERSQAQVVGASLGLSTRNKPPPGQMQEPFDHLLGKVGKENQGDLLSGSSLDRLHCHLPLSPFLLPNSKRKVLEMDIGQGGQEEKYQFPLYS